VQLFRFAVVGTFGFAADALVLLTLTSAFDVQPLPARIGSFTCAATLTYLLNRRFTFEYSGRGAFGLWPRYMLTTGIGAVINISVYHAWIGFAGTSPFQLVVGSAIGSVTALFFNYFVSRTLVFRT
jgi:putative flippase GtrA